MFSLLAEVARSRENRETRTGSIGICRTWGNCRLLSTQSCGGKMREIGGISPAGGLLTHRVVKYSIMANGNTVTRNVGFAILRIGEDFTVDEVVFAQEGDLCLLGARTLDGMNLRVDPRGKKLVAAGPVPAA